MGEGGKQIMNEDSHDNPEEPGEPETPSPSRGSRRKRQRRTPPQIDRPTVPRRRSVIEPSSEPSQPRGSSLAVWSSILVASVAVSVGVGAWFLLRSSDSAECAAAKRLSADQVRYPDTIEWVDCEGVTLGDDEWTGTVSLRATNGFGTPGRLLAFVWLEKRGGTWVESSQSKQPIFICPAGADWRCSRAED